MQYQTITLPIVAGINTKTDPLASQPPQLNSLVNGSFQTIGSIKKRLGYAALSQNTNLDTILNNGLAVGNFQRELLQFDGTNLYSYSPSTETWISKGVCNSFKSSKIQIARSPFNLTLADIGAVENVALFAYTNSGGGIYITVVDLVTGTQYQSQQLIDATATYAKCYTIGNSIWVACAQAPEVRVYQIDALSPGEFFGNTAPISTLGANALFDIVAYDPSSAMCTWADLTNTVNVAYITQSGFLGDVANGYPDPFVTTETATTALTIAISTDLSQLEVLYANTTQYVRAFGLYAVLSGYIWGPTTLDASVGTITRTTAAYDPNGDGWRNFWSYDFANNSNNYTFTNLVGLDGAVESPEQLYRSLTLASKAYVYGPHVYVGLEYSSILQSTYFTAREDGLLMGRHLGSAGGPISGQSTLPNVYLLDGDVAYWPLVELSQNFGIDCIVNDSTFSGLFNQAETGLADIIAGGCLKAYDGAQVVEQNFFLYPEGATFTPSNMGGFMASGNYLYRIVYEWYDAQGQFYQSGISLVSPIFSGTNQDDNVTVVGPTGSVLLTIPTLRVTLRQGVVISIYRSLVASTDALYRVGQVNNNTDVDTVTFTDTLNDTAIQNGYELYTDTGELDNDPAPSCTSIVVGKTRLFLIDDENGYIWFSKPFTAGFGVGFSSFLYVKIDGFTPTALAILDDKVLAFDEHRTFWFTGDGPDASGQGGTFSFPQILSTDVGCVNSASICRGPDGIYFQSAKGICMVSRQLVASYIGAPVEQYNNHVITSSVVVPNLNQIRFTTATGPTLVYDYYVGQWMIFENHSGLDATLWLNQYSYLRNTGQLMNQNTSYSDAGETYPLNIVTSWINLQQYQGYKRIRRASFLGTFQSDCSLTVNIYYDYNDSYYDTVTFNATTALNIVNFGDGGNYGDQTPYGSTQDNVLQWRVAIPRQKIQAIRFDIIDSTISGSDYSLAGIDIEIGIIGGLMRLPANKSL